MTKKQKYEKQKIKTIKKLKSATKKSPVLIKDWFELAEVEESKTHFLEIDLKWGNGWIYSKGKNKYKDCHYLSTHTFYDSCNEYSTKILQKYGFNVIIDNWDKKK